MSLENVVALARNENGIAAAVGVLKQRFGERAQTGQAIREQHGHTTTYVPTQAPDIVILPRLRRRCRTLSASVPNIVFLSSPLVPVHHSKGRSMHPPVVYLLTSRA